MKNAPNKTAYKISRSCQLVIVHSGWNIEIEAETIDANPKLTDRVMVQLPISQTQQVTKDTAALERPATR